MNRKHGLALVALILFVASCSGSPPVPDIPEGYNEKSVEGNDGASFSVKCATGIGKIFIPAGGFSGTKTIRLECVNTDDLADAEALIRQATGTSLRIGGALKVDPSPFLFNKNITVTIPLNEPHPEVAGRPVDLYTYDPALGRLSGLAQAWVDSQGLSATVQVDHFSIFIVLVW